MVVSALVKVPVEVPRHRSGPHSSNLANKMDPRVGSDKRGRSGLETTGASTGTATGVGNNATGTG